MLSWEFPPMVVGGLGRHVDALSGCLAEYGAETHILTPVVEGNPNFECINGAFVYRLGGSFKSAGNVKSWAFRFNSELIRRSTWINRIIGGVDIIHAHDWLVAYAARSLSKMLNVPLVTTIHATEHGRNRGIHNRIQQEIHDIEHNLVLDSDRVICCSNNMQREINSLFGVGINKIHIIPNGVAQQKVDERFYLSDLQLPGLGDNDRIVFFIGRLVPEKGIEDLIRAFPQVAEAVPEARLVVGGKGPQEKDLVELSSELGIRDRVIFTGFISDNMRDLIYHWADAAVFPSLYEPFGIVALEAMAAGTPIVVNDVGGLGEIIEDEILGLKVAPGNIDALARALIRILKDKELAGKLRKNAYKVIGEKYSWQKIAAQTVEIYRAAIGEAQKRGAI
ncbi:MAG: glycosyltransferase family 4 protein [Chitinophagales bacterium]